MVRLGGYGTPVEPNRHRLIRNEAWPKYPENFPARVPIEVVVHIWWAHGWPPETLPAIADPLERCLRARDAAAASPRPRRRVAASE